MSDLTLLPRAEEDTKEEPPHKWWRNRYWSDPAPMETQAEADGTWLSRTIWPSEDVARSRGRDAIDGAPAEVAGLIEYRGPVRVNENGEPL